MTTAATVAEYSANVGPDFTLDAAFDAAYRDVKAAEGKIEDVDLMSVEQRQALNARMAEWYGIG